MLCFKRIIVQKCSRLIDGFASEYRIYELWIQLNLQPSRERERMVVTWWNQVVVVKSRPFELFSRRKSIAYKHWWTIDSKPKKIGINNSRIKRQRRRRKKITYTNWWRKKNNTNDKRIKTSWKIQRIFVFWGNASKIVNWHIEKKKYTLLVLKLNKKTTLWR